eukprot:TRINITY_DN1429_c0_g1_i5.p1 TRINITY_DN1429_c0_g1~~TRINITY_DN1429_c0_g1_i5.p1  ORF type:complete len:186 (+),score=14.11 TRINITY_DN1429_c0_g1_i5:1453-2010(+)
MNFDHVAVVERLLRIEGVDPCAQNYVGVRQAVGNGYVEVMQAVLQRPGAKFSAEFLAIVFDNSWFRIRQNLAFMEEMLGNSQVAAWFGLEPHRVLTPVARHLAALQIFRAWQQQNPHAYSVVGQMVQAYGLAYLVVREGGLPIGVDELVCQSLSSPGLAQITVVVHRTLRSMLNSLRALQNCQSK